jgi:hypothetical protein
MKSIGDSKKQVLIELKVQNLKKIQKKYLELSQLLEQNNMILMKSSKD